MMAVVSPMLVERTERGDEMFMAILARHAQQALDLDALAMLPAPGGGRAAAAASAPTRRRIRRARAAVNESWYFDVADPGRASARTSGSGRTRTTGVLVHGADLRPGRPTVALIDFARSAAGDDLAVRTEGSGAQLCEEPLSATACARRRGRRTTTRGAAARRARRAGRRRARPVWETDGDPFHTASRRATRSRARQRARSGRRRAFGSTRAGQRDHSWGVRDWWGDGRVWSAGHLDDGTHLHGVDVRIRRAADGDRLRPASGRPPRARAASKVPRRSAPRPVAPRPVLPEPPTSTQLQPLGHGPLLLGRRRRTPGAVPAQLVPCAAAADGRNGRGLDRVEPRPVPVARHAWQQEPHPLRIAGLAFSSIRMEEAGSGSA